MATHPGFFQPFETASQDAPFFLPQCCCDSELLPDGLLTLLEKVWDLKHRRMLYLHITSWAQTHAQNHTHTCSRAMSVSPNSLWQRVLAVFMLHHSLSSLTAWPSNTAFQWRLKFNTYKFFKTLIQLDYRVYECVSGLTTVFVVVTAVWELSSTSSWDHHQTRSGYWYKKDKRLRGK